LLLLRVWQITLLAYSHLTREPRPFRVFVLFAEGGHETHRPYPVSSRIMLWLVSDGFLSNTERPVGRYMEGLTQLNHNRTCVTPEVCESGTRRFSIGDVFGSPGRRELINTGTSPRTRKRRPKF